MHGLGNGNGSLNIKMKGKLSPLSSERRELSSSIDRVSLNKVNQSLNFLKIQENQSLQDRDISTTNYSSLNESLAKIKNQNVNILLIYLNIDID